MEKAIILRFTLLLFIVSFAKCSSPAVEREHEGGRVANDPGAAEATSPLGRPLYATPPMKDRARQEMLLLEAQKRLREDPNDPGAWVWVGRRLGYLWRMTEAIEVYTRGIQRFPKDAALYRHRGHRYITVRQFDKAIADLESASRLMSGLPDVIEQDGMPNEKNIPLTTLHFNVWYHLGVAHYVKGDFSKARVAFGQSMHCRGKHDDNLVAATDWLYMTLRRLGHDDEANALLQPISEDMDIIENQAYLDRLLIYKGITQSDDIFNVNTATELDLATMGYGVGNWYFCEGDRARAVTVFEKVVAGGYWPAFGYIAAEADLARMRGN